MRLVWLLAAGCSYAPRVAEPVDVPIDVERFDAARDCPVEYQLALAGQTSRYRIVIDGRKAWEHSDDCNDDRAGATHLVAIDDAAELDQVEIALNATGNLDNDKAWVGGVQLVDQSAVGVGWLSITGGPLPILWGVGEPNDGGDNEDNDENFAGVERDRDGLDDVTTGDDQGGMCECDGKPPDPMALAAIDANR